jgi:hypothetical protein
MALPDSAFHTYNASLTRKCLLVPAAGIQDIMYQTEVKSVDEFVDKIFSDQDFYKGFMQWSEAMPFCGSNHGDIHLLYDGTVITCQNYIFDTDKDYLVAENEMEMAVKKSLIDKGLFIKPLEASQEEISKFLNIFTELKSSSYRFLLDQTINLMFWMSKAN